LEKPAKLYNNCVADATCNNSKASEVW